MRVYLTIVSLLAGLALAAQAMEQSAKSDASRFKSIPERNIFGIKEPPPPPPPPAPPPPAIKVQLTGIVTLLASKRALLVVSEAGKPGESKMMKEGERDGQVEVLAIDEKAGKVFIKNCGQEDTLDFKNNGIAPPTGPAVTNPVAGVPGAPGQPGQPGAINPNLPPNLVRPPGQPGAPTNAPAPVVPSRILRVQ